MRSYSGQVEHCRSNETFVDLPAIPKIRDIAANGFKPPQKVLLAISAKELFSQLHRAGGVLQHLHGLLAGRLVEEPAATCVHQHQMPLKLEQPEYSDFFIGGEPARRMLVEKPSHADL